MNICVHSVTAACVSGVPGAWLEIKTLDPRTVSSHDGTKIRGAGSTPVGYTNLK